VISLGISAVQSFFSPSFFIVDSAAFRPPPPMRFVSRGFFNLREGGRLVYFFFYGSRVLNIFDVLPSPAFSWTLIPSILSFGARRFVDRPESLLEHCRFQLFVNPPAPKNLHFLSFAQWWPVEFFTHFGKVLSSVVWLLLWRSPLPPVNFFCHDHFRRSPARSTGVFSLLGHSMWSLFSRIIPFS